LHSCRANLSTYRTLISEGTVDKLTYTMYGMKKLPAKTTYYVRCVVWEFNSGLIFTSIWVLYYSVMKLNLFEISLISIVITVSNLVLEVPTGILADVYSRRLSVILG
jgi:hypothetical protein